MIKSATFGAGEECSETRQRDEREGKIYILARARLVHNRTRKKNFREGRILPFRIWQRAKIGEKNFQFLGIDESR